MYKCQNDFWYKGENCSIEVVCLKSRFFFVSTMDELFDFLTSPRLDVKNEAVKIVAGLTGDKQYFELFKIKDQKPIQDLMMLVKDEPLTAHDALAALTNLSADVSFIETMSDVAFLNELILLMMVSNGTNVVTK
jgi:hypothetical protein